MAGDAVDPADLARGSTDFRYLLTQNRVPDKFEVTLFQAGIDTIAKFSASFKDEADLKSVLAKDFSIEPEASLASRALAAAFVVAWRAAQARTRTREQADREAASEMREWAKPIPQTEYMAMRQAFAQKFGEPEDKHVPAKEYIERKLHELETGEFRAEPLNEVLSRDEIDPDTLVPKWDSRFASGLHIPSGACEPVVQVLLLLQGLAILGQGLRY